MFHSLGNSSVLVQQTKKGGLKIEKTGGFLLSLGCFFDGVYQLPDNYYVLCWKSLSHMTQAGKSFLQEQLEMVHGLSILSAQLLQVLKPLDVGERSTKIT